MLPGHALQPSPSEGGGLLTGTLAWVYSQETANSHIGQAWFSQGIVAWWHGRLSLSVHLRYVSMGDKGFESHALAKPVW